MQQSLNGFNSAISRQAEQWSALNDEIADSIEAGKEEMIRRHAEANAEAYAKLIVRERIITRHRFPMDNFEHDIIREDAYKDIKLEDLV